MRHWDLVASTYLAVGFGVATFIAVFVEPGMGFRGFADFFDATKLVAGAGSTAWMIGDVIFLGFGLALAHLSLSHHRRAVTVAGLAAGVGFFFVGALGRVFAALPSLIGDSELLATVLVTIVPIRLAVLRTTVFALGLFAWGTTRPTGDANTSSIAWRGFGHLVLVASTAFVFVFIPVPILFTLWAVWLSLRHARGDQRPSLS